MKTVPERVSALRALMAARGIDTYIIVSSDPHQSEYVASYWRARAYISGFTGSAGTVVVTQDKAACWVDGRYFLQGEQQLKGTGIDLMKIGEPGVPTWQQYVVDNTKEQGVVGMDGRTIGNFQATMLKKLLERKQLGFACKEDLINEVWEDRPALPQEPIIDLDVAYTGESRAEKLARLRAHMEEKKADYYLIASLESSAWLLNYRGADIYATPVAYAFTLVGKETCDLFIELAKVTPEMKALLAKDGVTVHPYDALTEYWKTLPKSRIAMDRKIVNEMLVENLPEGWTIAAEETDAVIAMKAVKNETEQANFRKAHIKDGAVMVQLLKWVKDHAASGVTECDVAAFLDQLRIDQEHSLGISFGTIAGYGPNGAIVHYAPNKETCATLQPKSFLLVDSGAQYLEGTTDVTRTIACGPLTDEEKEAYTLVLKGHLALGHAMFKAGATGSTLDILARKPLWERGLDYKHGTGHGVGYLLSVHEGPQNISTVQNRVRLEPGMVISNEPGYYPTGKFGVRIENLVLVVPYTENEWGTFYRMETLTMCPYERDAIVKELLTEEEIRQIDAYHQEVLDKVGPLLDAEHLAFLKEATKPL